MTLKEQIKELMADTVYDPQAPKPVNRKIVEAMNLMAQEIEQVRAEMGLGMPEGKLDA